VRKTLLEKSRLINNILQKIIGNPVDFFEMARVLDDNLECSVFIIDRRGQVIGYSFAEGLSCSQIDRLIKHAENFPELFNQEFAGIRETRSNIKLEKGRRCIFNYNEMSCDCSRLIWSITPVFGGAGRIGTLVLCRDNQLFTDEDIVLIEYGSLVVANEVMRINNERVEEESRKKAAVQMAVSTLSYSEKQAIEYILTELNAQEGLLIASKLADKAGITRSIIVSALRKFSSAGVIESRSLGMKGTYIKILNNYIRNELNK
jgi:transcriptional pleiotropic repressor